MEALGIGIATVVVVWWLLIVLLWLVSFGTTLHSRDVWPDRRPAPAETPRAA